MTRRNFLLGLLAVPVAAVAAKFAKVKPVYGGAAAGGMSRGAKWNGLVLNDNPLRPFFQTRYAGKRAACAYDLLARVAENKGQKDYTILLATPTLEEFVAILALVHQFNRETLRLPASEFNRIRPQSYR